MNDAGDTQDNCFLYEWGGVVYVGYRNLVGTVTIFKTDVGTVNAETGLITIANFIPTAIEDGALDIRIRVIPTINDFTPHLNQLFTIDPSSIAVQLLNIATATTDEQRNFFTGGVLP